MISSFFLTVIMIGNGVCLYCIFSIILFFYLSIIERWGGNSSFKTLTDILSSIMYSILYTA